MEFLHWLRLPLPLQLLVLLSAQPMERLPLPQLLPQLLLLV
jgi:hypothetical protein